jgi:hypothetical protein
MKLPQLRALRIFSLLFLFPGLGGLFYSAYLSTYYLETLPKTPDPQEERMTPRGIHGITIFQTQAEDRHLSFYEDSSVAVFLIGLVMGTVYLEKWAAARSVGEENSYENRI